MTDPAGPDPNDGRACLVTVAPAGRDPLARLRRERTEVLAGRITRLTAEQRDALHPAVPVLELLVTDPEPTAEFPPRTHPA